MAVSEKFRVAYLVHHPPRYKLADGCGCSSTWLSKVVHGYGGKRFAPPGDPRIICVGAKLGLAPAECFEKEEKGNGRKKKG